MTYDGGERSFPVSVKSDAPYSDNNVAVRYYDSKGTELERSTCPMPENISSMHI